MRLNKKILTITSFFLVFGLVVACNKPNSHAVAPTIVPPKPPVVTNIITTSLSYCDKNICTFDIKSKDALSAFSPTVDVQPAGYAMSDDDSAKLTELGLQMDRDTGVITKQPDLILNEQPATTILIEAVDIAGLVLVATPVKIQLTNKVNSLVYCQNNQCYFDSNSQETLLFKPIVDATPAGYFIPNANDLANLNYLGLQLNKTTGVITKQDGFNLKAGRIKITIEAVDSYGVPYDTLVDLTLTEDDKLSYPTPSFQFTLDTSVVNSISPNSDQFDSFQTDQAGQDILESYGLSLNPDNGVISGQVISPTANTFGDAVKISARNKNSLVRTTVTFQFEVTLYRILCPELKSIEDVDWKNTWKLPSSNSNKMSSLGTGLTFLSAELDGGHLECIYKGPVSFLFIESKKSISRTINEIMNSNPYWKLEGAQCEGDGGQLAREQCAIEM